MHGLLNDLCLAPLSGTKLREKLSTGSFDADEYALAAESRDLGIELREKFFKTRRGHPYRLLYVIEGNEVRVLRVRGPGQPPVDSDDIRN